jgi:hemin uptake protein HemP
MNTSFDEEKRRKTRGATSVGEPHRRIPVHDNRINSRDLFADIREITIAHGEETYRLRLTSQNKLILTK